jgi:hypothetical protein
MNMTESKPIWMRPKANREIVVCLTCHGTGLLRVRNENPAYDGPHTVNCYACAGNGRVMQTIIKEHFVLDSETLFKNTY